MPTFNIRFTGYDTATRQQVQRWHKVNAPNLYAAIDTLIAKHGYDPDGRFIYRTFCAGKERKPMPRSVRAAQRSAGPEEY